MQQSPNESMQERGKIKQTHRFYSTKHNMKTGDPILTGKYLSLPSRQQPPQQIAEAIGMEIPPALQSMEKENLSRG